MKTTDKLQNARIFFFSLLLIIFLFPQLYAQKDVINTPQGELSVFTINHGSLVLQWQNKTIYVDPYGLASIFKQISPPDLILISDIHGDHYNPETLMDLPYKQAQFIVPQAVAELMKDQNIEKNKVIVINNGEQKVMLNLLIEAVPMYNLPESAESRHTKGRGNGYIISSGKTRIYISGDTEDIPEMRKLKNIDVAFICMNLPYTMSVNQAADAVLDFKPKIVYPYHYRGEGEKLSDVEEFKKLVNAKNPKIEVRLRDWYSSQK
jgi:L-ascorbate metabolism protein UlaG (beta-lactamase superfamily)